jgi:hypothetical protein
MLCGNAAIALLGHFEAGSLGELLAVWRSRSVHEIRVDSVKGAAAGLRGLS